jgi:hypothetical protein
MSSDSDYTYYVAIVETGDALATYAGRDYFNSGGRFRSGVENVSFEDGGVVARHYNGTVERLELPARIAIIDDEYIELTYASGRTERRERRPVTGTSKFGQPYAITTLR